MQDNVLLEITDIIESLKESLDRKEKDHKEEFERIRAELHLVEDELGKLKETSITKAELQSFQKRIAKFNKKLERISIGELED
jgi:cob(I)alamin adenosyltransferase